MPGNLISWYENMAESMRLSRFCPNVKVKHYPQIKHEYQPEMLELIKCDYFKKDNISVLCNVLWGSRPNFFFCYKYVFIKCHQRNNVIQEWPKTCFFTWITQIHQVTWLCSHYTWNIWLRYPSCPDCTQPITVVHDSYVHQLTANWYSL